MTLQITELRITEATPCMEEEDRWFSDDPEDIEYAKDACLDCPLMHLGCRDEGWSAEFGVFGALSAEDRWGPNGWSGSEGDGLDDVDRTILAMANAGAPRESIEKAVGLSFSGIYRRTRKLKTLHGIKVPPIKERKHRRGRKSATSPDVLAEAVRLHREEGQTFSELGRRLGIPASRISYHAKKLAPAAA